MVKVRNLLKQFKERVELEVSQALNENQAQQNTSSPFGGLNSNTEQSPSLLGLLASSIDKTLAPAIERPGPSDDSSKFVTVFCGTCLQVKRESLWAQVSLAHLESAVEDGCHFCYLLAQGLYALLPDMKGAKGKLNLSRGDHWLEMKVIREDERGISIGSNGEWPILEFSTSSQDSFPLHEVGVYGYSVLGNSKNLVTSGDTSSAASFAIAMDWIKTCSQQHKSCDRSVTPFLPTRILDTSAWPTVKLYESQGKRAQYIALSHSWGGHHPIVTTTSTLLEHKKGIHFNTLPKTYQEAILITRRLGQRYIWIDSLCIIQDSKSDWEREGAQMATVYQNAWLTISATRSSSPTSGCYNSMAKQTVEFKGFIRNSPFVLYARRQMEHVAEDWGPDFGGAAERRKFPLPLLTRGWAFQERLLSARVLHFGPQELFWECRELVTCECKGIGQWEKDANIVTYQGAPPKITHNRFVSVSATPGQLHARWRSMVEEYCRRSLTVGTDRLPGFAGVATEMQGYLHQRYIAGLWEDSLVTDLMWYRGWSNATGGRVRKRGGSTWPGIPSWSWAAVDGQINYDGDLTQPDPKRRRDSPCTSCCEVLEAKWTLGDPNAYLVLEAWVLPARLCVSNRPGRGDNVPMLLDEAIRTNHSILNVEPGKRRLFYLVCINGSPDTSSFFDVDFPLYDEGEWYIEEGEQVYCAKLSTQGESKHRDRQWLVLKCLDAAAQVYERIGFASNPLACWPCPETKQRIKLV